VRVGRCSFCARFPASDLVVSVFSPAARQKKTGTTNPGAHLRPNRCAKVGYVTESRSCRPTERCQKSRHSASRSRSPELPNRTQALLVPSAVPAGPPSATIPAPPAGAARRGPRGDDGCGFAMQGLVSGRRAAGRRRTAPGPYGSRAGSERSTSAEMILQISPPPFGARRPCPAVSTTNTSELRELRAQSLRSPRKTRCGDGARNRSGLEKKTLDLQPCPCRQ